MGDKSAKNSSIKSDATEKKGRGRRAVRYVLTPLRVDVLVAALDMRTKLRVYRELVTFGIRRVMMAGLGSDRVAAEHGWRRDADYDAALARADREMLRQRATWKAVLRHAGAAVPHMEGWIGQRFTDYWRAYLRARVDQEGEWTVTKAVVGRELGVSGRTVVRLMETAAVYSRHNYVTRRLDLKRARGSYELEIREIERRAGGRAKLVVHSVETPSGLVEVKRWPYQEGASDKTFKRLADENAAGKTNRVDVVVQTGNTYRLEPFEGQETFEEKRERVAAEKAAAVACEADMGGVEVAREDVVVEKVVEKVAKKAKNVQKRDETGRVGKKLYIPEIDDHPLRARLYPGWWVAMQVLARMGLYLRGHSAVAMADDKTVVFEYVTWPILWWLINHSKFIGEEGGYFPTQRQALEEGLMPTHEFEINSRGYPVAVRERVVKRVEPRLKVPLDERIRQAAEYPF